MAKSPKPVTPGRVVNYVLRSAEGSQPYVMPAIVVAVSSTETDDIINVHAFADAPSTLYKIKVPYSETKAANSWHWPEIK